MSSNKKEAKKPRAGAWTKEEVEYVEELIRGFHAGWLDLKEGKTLRRFLADSVGCREKRISKRFENSGYEGRKSFLKQLNLNHDEVQAKRVHLRSLKRRFDHSVKVLENAKAGIFEPTQFEAEDTSEPLRAASEAMGATEAAASEVSKSSLASEETEPKKLPPLKTAVKPSPRVASKENPLQDAAPPLAAAAGTARHSGQEQGTERLHTASCGPLGTSSAEAPRAATDVHALAELLGRRQGNTSAALSLADLIRLKSIAPSRPVDLFGNATTAIPAPSPSAGENALLRRVLNGYTQNSAVPRAPAAAANNLLVTGALLNTNQQNNSAPSATTLQHLQDKANTMMQLQTLQDMQLQSLQDKANAVRQLQSTLLQDRLQQSNTFAAATSHAAAAATPVSHLQNILNGNTASNVLQSANIGQLAATGSLLPYSRSTDSVLQSLAAGSSQPVLSGARDQVKQQQQPPPAQQTQLEGGSDDRVVSNNLKHLLMRRGADPPETKRLKKF